MFRELAAPSLSPLRLILKELRGTSWKRILDPHPPVMTAINTEAINDKKEKKKVGISLLLRGLSLRCPLTI